MRSLRCALAALTVACIVTRGVSAHAQDLFEIQVYPYDTVEPGRTMLEFHTNFTPSGTKTSDGVFPNHQQFHVTMEVTHGFTKHFETGFYLETAPYVPDHGAQFVGWHIRPRFSVPEIQQFPFKMSFSFEYAFNQRGFDPNPQTLEIRPIFDLRPLAGHSSAQLPNGVIDLRRTAQPLNVIHQDLGRARVGEQKWAQKVPAAPEFERPPRVNALILGDVKLMTAQIRVGDFEQVLAGHIFLCRTI